MTVAAVEQQAGEREALPRRAQTHRARALGGITASRRQLHDADIGGGPENKAANAANTTSIAGLQAFDQLLYGRHIAVRVKRVVAKR